MVGLMVFTHGPRWNHGSTDGLFLLLLLFLLLFLLLLLHTTKFLFLLGTENAVGGGGAFAVSTMQSCLSKLVEQGGLEHSLQDCETCVLTIFTTSDTLK